MKKKTQRLLKKKNVSALYFIVPPDASSNSRYRILVYLLIGAVFVLFLFRYLDDVSITKIGIALEMLSFIFISPELFGIKDISGIQIKVLKTTERVANFTLKALLDVSDAKLPTQVGRFFKWLTWPYSKIYLPDDITPTPYDWINSIEKSIPLAFMNLLLLWIPGIALIVGAFLGRSYSSQVSWLTPTPPSPLIDLMLSFIFIYNAFLHTTATVTWHLNAVATRLKEDHERRLLAILGVVLFIFGSFLQLLAA